MLKAWRKTLVIWLIPTLVNDNLPQHTVRRVVTCSAKTKQKYYYAQFIECFPNLISKYDALDM